MSQSINLSVTDSAEAPQPELEASGYQGILLSDLSPPSPVTDETDETPSAPAREPTEEGPLVWFRTWISENKMSVAGLILALLSLIVATIATVPSFRSESMSQRALELAEWTALKDFIENCEQDHQAGLASVACQEAITQTIPPPPHVRIPSFIIKRWMDNDYTQRDESSYLRTVVYIIISFVTNRVFYALFAAIYKIWFTKFPKCSCVKNTRFRVVNFAEIISKFSRYEMIDYDAHEPLDAQVAKVRSKHRFVCVSRTYLALSDRIETLERGEYDTVPWLGEIASLHASTSIHIDKATKIGLINLAGGFSSLAFCICKMMIIYKTY